MNNIQLNNWEKYLNIIKILENRRMWKYEYNFGNIRVSW